MIEGGGAAVEVSGNATGSNITNSIIIDNRNDGTAPSEVAGKDGALTEDIEFIGSNIVGADADAFDASGEENAINADPALIFEDTATTVVEPGWRASLADHANLILTRADMGRGS